MTLAAACSIGSLALLDRIWANSCLSAGKRTSRRTPVDYLRSDRDYHSWQFSRAMEEAARCGHLHVVQWLFARFCNSLVRHRVVDAAAREGHLPILKFLCQYQFDARVLEPDRPAGFGNGNMVIFGHDDTYEATRNGHAEIVQWLYQRTPNLQTRRTTTALLRAALDNNDLQLVEWLLAHDCNDDVRYNYYCLPHLLGHLHVVQWIYATYGEQSLCDDLLVVQDTYGASDHGRAFTVSPTTILDAAAVHGHLDVLQFLHGLDNRSTEASRPERGRRLEATRVAMDGAAERGHLEVVKWLHDNRLEGCTTAAMDLAAAWGHLKVVTWLHENRSEGCTSNAMDHAAANGHLKVVQFLHAHRREGCTNAALEEATVNDHFDMVLFLHSQRTEGYSREWLRLAEEHTILLHADVRIWLGKRYPSP
ncbi:hypothetical protein BBJ28_00014748 [Nothophytophthora sp. Chile5]|nr:hypothetical protein BBJ28_00014748 [Nothophytophthora sp. Chile5]